MLAYMKVSPTTYVLHYQGGRVRRQGPGLAFWYLRPVSTIVAVPLASRDVPFAFNEVTADFQAVTLQGQLTYRVADPARLPACSTSACERAASTSPTTRRRSRSAWCRRRKPSAEQSCNA